MKCIDADRLIDMIDNSIAYCQINYSDDYAFGFEQSLREVKRFIDSLQQEQTEISLEKFTEKIRTFQGRYKHPEIVSIKSAMAFMARMFYQYPNAARLWYDSLPKATMD